MQLKVMYKETVNDIYCERLHEDIQGAIKKAKGMVQLAEEIVLEHDEKGPEYLKVASDKIDAFFTVFNNINTFYNRLKTPKTAPKKRKRDEGEASDDDE